MDYKECEILIVEDNADDAELMIRALNKKNIANHIIHLKDGEQALNFLLNRDKYSDCHERPLPKVILLDLKLPKLSGIEVLKELKANSETKKIPVVIITSSRENPDIKDAYDNGANSYIVKPIDFNDFVNTLNQIGLYWMVVNQKPNQ